MDVYFPGSEPGFSSTAVWLTAEITPQATARYPATDTTATGNATGAARIAAEIGTWEWNVETGEAILNNRWFEIVGYTPEGI